MDSLSIHAVLKAVANTSAKTTKLAILTQNKALPGLSSFLGLAYDPQTSFYQGQVPEVEVAPPYGHRSFNEDVISDVVNTLAKRALTGNAAKAWLSKLYADMATEADRDLLSWLILRDVRAGFSESTINKVWPKLVNDPAYMRCAKPSEVKMDKIDYSKGVYSELKSDGQFLNMTMRDELVLTTRNGNIFPVMPSHTALRRGAVALAKEVSRIAKERLAEHPSAQYLDNIQLHGEQLVDLDGVLMTRAKGNAKLNSIFMSGAELDEHYRVHSRVWDWVPVWHADEKEPFLVSRELRLEILEEAFKNLGEAAEALELVEYVVVYSWAEALVHYQKLLSRGEEGTVLKIKTGIWFDGTSKDQIKMKLFAELDLRPKRLRPGTGKNKDLFGALECESEEGSMIVGIPISGFTVKMAKWIVENWETVLSSILVAKANGFMDNTETGKPHSLFLPKFVEFRTDKHTADSWEDIKTIFASLINSGATETEADAE